MKKVLMVVGGLLGVAVLAVAGLAAMQPDHVHLERTKIMAAAPQDIFPYANDMGLWMKWNPWLAMDPAEKLEFSDPKAGKGAWYTWKGEKTGSGKMTVTESVPNERIVEDLAFVEPFAGQAVVTFTFTPDGENTKVTWGYDADNAPIHKVMGVFMSMEKMLGDSFDTGLATLKPLAEADATKRKADEAAAAAAAAVVVDPNAPVDPTAVSPAAPPTP